MRPILFAPVLILALSACATDGTQTAATAPVAAPVAASSGVIPTQAIPADPYVTGEIVLAEPIAPVSQRGGNAALAIGATVLGAFIPGPWGSVASVTAGQAGQYALSSAATRTTRYHVRTPDGAVRTVTQAGPLSLSAGTQVQILTLADGSSRLVQTSVPVPATIPG